MLCDMECRDCKTRNINKGTRRHKKETSELQDSASDVGQVREGVLALWSQWLMKLRRLL